MATPPTYVSNYSVAGSSSSATKTTASFNASTGDVLVLFVWSENSTNIRKPGTVSNTQGALTWTTRSEFDTNDYGGVAYLKVYTAIVDAAKTGMTVSIAGPTTSAYWGLDVIHYTGSDGVGAVNTANNGTSSGAASVSLTYTGANSATVMSVSDWNASSGSRTYLTINGSSPTERYYTTNSSYGTAFAATHADSGTATTRTVGTSAPTNLRYIISAIEILGAAASSTNYTVNQTDTDNITETVTTAQTHNLNLFQEFLNITETSTIAQTHNTNVTDSHNLTETVAFEQRSSVTDSHNLTDTVNLAQAHSSSVTDSENLTDTPTVAQTHNSFVLDTHGLSDAATIGFQYSVNITDNNNITETTTVARTLGVNVTDNQNLTETSTPAQAHLYNLTENLTLTELTTLAQTHNQAIINDLSLTESTNVVVVPPGILSVTSTDNLSLTEQIDAALAMAMSNTDNLGLTDVVSISQHYANSLVDIHALTDLLEFVTILHPIDNLNLTDQLTAAILYMNGYIDLLSLTDQATVDLVANGSLDVTEVLGLTDAVIFGGTIQEGSLSIVDRVMAWLGNLGYEGSIQDRQYYYLLDRYVATFGQPDVSLTQGDLQYFMSGHVREVLQEADYV